jgi:hypothetical protein
LAAAALCAGMAPSNDWFRPWRYRARLLLVFAPGEWSPLLQRQRTLVSAASAGSAERDLALLEVVGYHCSDSRVTGTALRQVYRVPMDRFSVVLLGKDGEEKWRSNDPVSSQSLFAMIDSMPMRRREMQNAASADGN